MHVCMQLITGAVSRATRPVNHTQQCWKKLSTRGLLGPAAALINAVGGACASYARLFGQLETFTGHGEGRIEIPPTLRRTCERAAYIAERSSVDGRDAPTREGSSNKSPCWILRRMLHSISAKKYRSCSPRRKTSALRIITTVENKKEKKCSTGGERSNR